MDKQQQLTELRKELLVLVSLLAFATAVALTGLFGKMSALERRLEAIESPVKMDRKQIGERYRGFNGYSIDLPIQGW